MASADALPLAAHPAITSEHDVQLEVADTPLQPATRRLTVAPALQPVAADYQDDVASPVSQGSTFSMMSTDSEQPPRSSWCDRFQLWLFPPPTIKYGRESYCSFTLVFLLLAAIQLLFCLLIWWFGYDSSHTTVSRLSDQFRAEVLLHASDQITAQMRSPYIAMNTLDALVQRRYANIVNTPYMYNQSMFINDVTQTLARFNQAISGVSIAWSNGAAMHLEMDFRPPQYSALPTYDIVDARSNYSTLSYHYTNLTAPVFNGYDSSPSFYVPYNVRVNQTAISTLANYHVNQRPIWLAGQAAGVNNITWTAPYSLANRPSTNVIAIVKANSVFGSGLMDYYVAAVLRLDTVITNMLSQLPAGNGGRVYLLNYDGHLYAASKASDQQELIAFNTTMYTITKSQQPYLWDMAPTLIPWLKLIQPGGDLGNNTALTSSLTVLGRPSHVQALLLAPNQNLRMMVVILTSNSDFDGAIDDATVTTAIYTAVACVLSLVLIAVISKFLSKGINRIIKYMHAVSQANEENGDSSQITTEKLQKIENDLKAAVWCPIVDGEKPATKKTPVIRSKILSQRYSSTMSGDLVDSHTEKTAGTIVRLPAVAKPSAFQQWWRRARLFAVKVLRPIVRNANVNELKLVEKTFMHMVDNLISSRKRADAAERARITFSSYIFHEIRVPLNAMTLGIEQLKQTPDLTEDTYEICDILSTQSTSVTRLLNDVLSIQRLESGQLSLDFKPFILERFIFTVVNSFSADYFRKQLNITLHLNDVVVAVATAGSPSRPAREWTATRVLGDQHRLKQALNNLLSNACKFTPEGGNIVIKLTTRPSARPSAAVRELAAIYHKSVATHTPSQRYQQSQDVTPQSEDDAQSPNDTLSVPAMERTVSDPTVDEGWIMAQISVIDDGVGVNAEDAVKLFQPYRQINAQELQQGKGSGLGLSIAKRLITMHGGQIGCKSIQQQETTFWFSAALQVLKATPKPSPGALTQSGRRHVSASHNLIPAVPSDSPVLNNHALRTHRNTLRTLLGVDKDVNALAHYGSSADQSPSTRTKQLPVRSPIILLGDAYSPSMPQRLLTKQYVLKMNERKMTGRNTATSLSASARTTSSSFRSSPATSVRTLMSSTPLEVPPDALLSVNGTTDHTIGDQEHSDTREHTPILNESRSRQLSVNAHVPSLSVSAPAGLAAALREISPLPAVSKRILIVEDTAPSRKLLAKMLERLKYVVDTCENGQECVDLMTGITPVPHRNNEPRRGTATSSRSGSTHHAVHKRHGSDTGVASLTLPMVRTSLTEHNISKDGELKPCNQASVSQQDEPAITEPLKAADVYGLILMDGQMPVLNGFDATRILREYGLTTPIVAVTGNALDEDRQRFIAAGVDDVLTKPLQVELLKAVLKKYMPLDTQIQSAIKPPRPKPTPTPN